MYEYANDIGKIPLLSEEETNELFVNMSSVNKVVSDASRSKLIKHNMRMVVKIAYKFENTLRISLEDRISIGSVGLIKAVDNFNLDLNYKFSTFAYEVIEKEFISYINALKTKKRSGYEIVSLSQPIYRDDIDERLVIEGTLSDAFIDNKDETLFLTKLTRESIMEVLACLKEKDREVILWRYGFYTGDQMTYQEVANVLGVSRARVNQREMRALEKLKSERNMEKLKEFYK